MNTTPVKFWVVENKDGSLCFSTIDPKQDAAFDNENDVRTVHPFTVNVWREPETNEEKIKQILVRSNKWLRHNNHCTSETGPECSCGLWTFDREIEEALK